MKRTFLALGLLAALLSAAVLLWSTTKPRPEPSVTQPLKEILPTGESYGWQHEDLPLGPTEALVEASERILNMSDFVYRRYRRGPEVFEVYIGYWEPGRMPARKMNEHTPDTCWRGAGWQWADREDDFVLTLPPSSSLPESASTSHRGRWRWFEKSGQRINVVYWHLLDGEPYQYGHQSLGQRFSQLVLDPFRYGFDLRREQFLIRISSPFPLDRVWDTPLMATLLQDLAFTGLLTDEVEPAAASGGVGSPQ
jgi:hypothetical protein